MKTFRAVIEDILDQVTLPKAVGFDLSLLRWKWVFNHTDIPEKSFWQDAALILDKWIASEMDLYDPPRMDDNCKLALEIWDTSGVAERWPNG
jgi:hypothetical protein